MEHIYFAFRFMPPPAPINNPTTATDGWTTVLEVANKEYGNFINVLSKAAIDCHWRKPDSCIGPVALPHYLTYDKNHNDGTTVYHDATDDVCSSTKKHQPHRRPSEFTKLLILMRRCNIQLYRDWVCTESHAESFRVASYRDFPVISDG